MTGDQNPSSVPFFLFLGAVALVVVMWRLLSIIFE